MKRVAYIIPVLLLLVLLSTCNTTYASTATQTKSAEREITIIEKTVCFNVSISDPLTNKTTSKEICVVIDFHIKNAKPSNDTINVEFPVSIHVGNKTITKKVIVPLKIEGEVTKIEVKSVEGGAEKSENVIIVAPQQAQQTTTPVQHHQVRPSQQKPQAQETVKPSSQPTKTVTVTKAVTNKNEQPSFDTVTILIVVAVLGVVAGVFILRKPRKEEKQSPTREYEEALKLVRQKLEEKEQEIERLKKTFPYRVMCPHCNNLVSPILTNDNRLLCPVCRGEIGTVTADGRLELTHSKTGGGAREAHVRGAKENEAGETHGKNNADAAGAGGKGGKPARERVVWQGKLSDIKTED